MKIPKISTVPESEKQVGNEQCQKGVWVVCLFVVELFELFV